MDEPLRGAVAQGIQYCLVQGTGYFSATDGRRWEIYETHRPVPIDEKRVVSFDLKGPSAAEACLQALSLWRPSAISGIVRSGQAPVVGLPPSDSPGTTGTQPIVGPGVQPSPITDEPGWQSISTLNLAPGSKYPRPSEILFPDNSRTRVKGWVRVTEAIVCWLMKKNFLTANHCPIQYQKEYILATSPTLPQWTIYEVGQGDKPPVPE